MKKLFNGLILWILSGSFALLVYAQPNETEVIKDLSNFSNWSAKEIIALIVLLVIVLIFAMFTRKREMAKRQKMREKLMVQDREEK